MIMTEQKPVEEILGFLQDEGRIFLVGCELCATLCQTGGEEQVKEMKARLEKEEKVAKVNEALCKGCGTCAAACPSGAAQVRGFNRGQILSMVDAALAV
jgi:heterodisulfide reductase subunit A-like polyferredoxin